MNYFTSNKFSFRSRGLPKDTFGVINFNGTEGLSRPYEFDIMLVSDNMEVDVDSIMKNRGRLILHREDGEDTVYNGVIVRFEQLHAFGEYAFYSARLVSKLWWISTIRHNQIMLNKNVPEIVRRVLVDARFYPDDYEFRLQREYKPIEYVCQYGESNLNFISRWLEKEGIYYYFEQSRMREKVIFTDSLTVHTDLPQMKTLIYEPPSGLDALHLKEVIKSFNCRRSLMPAKVFLKDYNYRKPSIEITGEAEVDPEGRGTVYYYHEHMQSPEDGKRLAEIRAESIFCRREEFYGESSVPYMFPGFTFTLDGHFKGGFNRKYLITDVTHEGSQTGYLLTGISTGLKEDETNRMYYRNNFTVIPASVQFRPEVRAEKPKISGAVVGKIDASGSGKYAELDEMGRYKVVIPFDLSGKEGGKSSSWVRMAQPYAGSDHGMHFPLHKGTEVLLTFIDGDPDRPIIAAAVPNPETPSPVTGDNRTMAVIRTGGQNRIAFEDKEGSERILLHSPKQGSYMRIGAPNDPDEHENKEKNESDEKSPSWEGETMEKDKEHFGIHIFTNGLLDEEAAAKNEVILGESTETVIGASIDTTIGEKMETSVLSHHEFMPVLWHYSLLHTEIEEAKADIAYMRNQFNGNMNRLVNQLNQVINNKIEALDVETKIAEMSNAIVVFCERSYERTDEFVLERNSLVTKEQNMKGEEIVLEMDKTNFKGKEVEVNGEKNEVTAQKTGITSEEAKMSSSIVESVMDKIGIGVEDTEIKGLKSIF